MADVKFVDHSTVELIDMMGGKDKIVASAKVSTKGYDASADGVDKERFIRFLLREQHMSPLESTVFTFRIKTPLFVQNQIVRHRTCAFSIESGRYKEFEPEFYAPKEHRPLGQVGKTGDYEMEHLPRIDSLIVRNAIENQSVEAYREYETMLSVGAAKEVARMVLPINVMSTMYMTVNLRNLLHLLELRTDHHAQWEIREVAFKMENILAREMPELYLAWMEDE